MLTKFCLTFIAQYLLGISPDVVAHMLVFMWEDRLLIVYVTFF